MLARRKLPPKARPKASKPRRKSRPSDGMPFGQVMTIYAGVIAFLAMLNFGYAMVNPNGPPVPEGAQGFGYIVGMVLASFLVGAVFSGPFMIINGVVWFIMNAVSSRWDAQWRRSSWG